MRIIKFRYWEKPDASVNFEGKMHYDSDEYFNKWCGNPEYETMQFTGLLDRHGKEIYEGDIVEWKYLQTWHKNEVRWVGGGFVVTTSGFKDDLNEPQDLSLVSILNCEIIGNIYENPELIKQI